MLLWFPKHIGSWWAILFRSMLTLSNSLYIKTLLYWHMRVESGLLCPAALSGVTCTACVSPLRGSFHWDYSPWIPFSTEPCRPVACTMLWWCVRGPCRRLGGAGMCGGTYRRLDLLHTFPSREKCEKKSWKGSFAYFPPLESVKIRNYIRCRGRKPIWTVRALSPRRSCRQSKCRCGTSSWWRVSHPVL